MRQESAVAAGPWLDANKERDENEGCQSEGSGHQSRSRGEEAELGAFTAAGQSHQCSTTGIPPTHLYTF